MDLAMLSEIVGSVENLGTGSARKYRICARTLDMSPIIGADVLGFATRELRLAFTNDASRTFKLDSVT